MTKQEFLQGLKSALEGQASTASIQENLRFYDDYIDAEIRSGRSESDVVAELGEPRWIAKTIIDVSQETEGETFADETGYRQESHSDEPHRNPIHYYDLSKWYLKLATMLVIMVIFWVVVAIIGGILRLIIPLMPVIALTAFVMWILRGPRR